MKAALARLLSDKVAVFSLILFVVAVLSVAIADGCL